LQNALQDYEGTVLIVSHNRSFLDPLVTRTLEFRPGQAPRLFAGNITYYLEKTAAEQAAPPAKEAPASRSAPPSGGNRKEQKRREAELRQQRSKLLKPLESELEQLEARIAELEGAQATLTAALSSEEMAADPDKLHQTSIAVQQVTEKLEPAYSRWAELSDQVDKVRSKLEAQ
jgi:ATP-binding cassette subfamily F protein 3